MLLGCGSRKVSIFKRNVGVTQGYTLQGYHVSSTSVCTHMFREKNTCINSAPKEIFKKHPTALTILFPKNPGTLYELQIKKRMQLLQIA